MKKTALAVATKQFANGVKNNIQYLDDSDRKVLLNCLIDENAKREAANHRTTTTATQPSPPTGEADPDQEVSISI